MSHTKEPWRKALDEEITLRDHIAIEALKIYTEAMGVGSCFPIEINPDNIAYKAYILADAMLKARNEGQKS